jgi:hypothetical protein
MHKGQALHRVIRGEERILGSDHERRNGLLRLQACLSLPIPTGRGDVRASISQVQQTVKLYSQLDQIRDAKYPRHGYSHVVAVASVSAMGKLDSLLWIVNAFATSISAHAY